MSISSALSNAISGLTASARSAGVVSSNLANVLTEGYASREVELRARGPGMGGVFVGDVHRNVNTALLAERRLADSEVSYNRVLVEVSAGIEQAIGAPDEDGSLSAMLTSMEASLITAAARPEETVRLRDVMIKADNVATKFNAISKKIQDDRMKLDSRIGNSVDEINTILAQTEKLNAQIVKSQSLGQSSLTLQDQRQSLIDRLSDLVPVRLAARKGGAVAIYTQGGAALLDGKAAKLSFEPSNLIVAHMTVDNGLLSGLEINGVTVTTNGDRGMIAGGRLAALFEARDIVAPAAQTRLDALARDLVERFQQPGLDPSIAAGQPALFTDVDGAFDPGSENGLSGRIRLNALVNEAEGGAVWKIRDGLGATAPGVSGDATLLQSFSEVLSRKMLPNSAGTEPITRSLSEHLSSYISDLGQNRLNAENDLSFASALQVGLEQAELEQGVDSDEQLQRLLLIEQAYAANARMVQVVENLIDTLIRI